MKNATKSRIALITLVSLTLAAPVSAGRATTRWVFDRLDRIGGLPVHVEGQPRIEQTPLGKAIAFDGVDDALFIDRHPLAGARTFTFEALIRPDGGAFEQRWFHLASDPLPGAVDDQTRIMFELRVVGDQWYLDAFAKGKGYGHALVAPNKLHPVGRWYHVAQTFDGTTYRSYVNGVLQDESPLAFTPQTAGRSSVGVRINRVNYFHGAIREARFSAYARKPGDFALLSPVLKYQKSEDK